MSLQRLLNTFRIFGRRFQSQSLQQELINQKEWHQFPLSQVFKLNYNTSIFRFDLPSPDLEFGVKAASSILVEGVDRSGNILARPYTPISKSTDKGFFDLLVKDYPTGNVSSYFFSLKIGDTIKVKGPYKKIEYKPNMFKKIGMIAGGTGITPMLQVIHAVLDNPNDTTELSVIFANNTEDDILLKNELDELQRAHDNLKIYYVLTTPKPNWNQGIGYISKEIILSHLPAPVDRNIILVCGPPGMMKLVSGQKAPDKSQGQLTGLLKECGYEERHVYKI